VKKKVFRHIVESRDCVDTTNEYQSLQRSIVPSADDLGLLRIVGPELQHWITRHMRNNASGNDTDKWSQIFSGNVLELISAVGVKSESSEESAALSIEKTSAAGQAMWCLFALCDSANIDIAEALLYGVESFTTFREERYGTDVIERLRISVLDSMKKVKTGGSYQYKLDSRNKRTKSKR